MAYSIRRLIPKSLQDSFIKLLSPLITLFLKWGLRPNYFTIAGVVITSFGAAVFMLGHIRPAGLLILFGGFCDTIDGLLARTSGKASRFGALLDSTADRYSEFIIYLGIGAYFINFNWPWNSTSSGRGQRQSVLPDCLLMVTPMVELSPQLTPRSNQ